MKKIFVLFIAVAFLSVCCPSISQAQNPEMRLKELGINLVIPAEPANIPVEIEMIVELKGE